MEKIHGILLCGLIMANIVFAIHTPSCKIKNKMFEICKTSNVLVSVTEISTDNMQENLRESLHIEDEEITTIASKTFRDLMIVELMISLKDTNLHLEKESFSGLPILQSLKILSGIVTIKPDLFLGVKNIDSLMLRINAKKQSLENAFQELKKLTTMKLHESNLGEVNNSTFFRFLPNITSFILTGNNILKIQPKAFVTFNDLKLLEFIGNSILTIERGAFEKLHKLETLNIVNEKITTIERGVFNELRSLKKLTIASSNVVKIQDEAFRGLDLESLDLKNNQLSTIDRNTFSGLRTQFLDLSMNPIGIIKQNAFTNSELEKIHLPFPNLTHYDMSYWGFGNSMVVGISYGTISK